MTKRIPLICLTLAALAPTPAIATLAVTEGPPEGFETLATPRATAVTVSYGGDVLGIFPAHFTPGTLTFDHPEEIIKHIPALKEKDRVLHAITGSLPAHADLLCRHGATDNCGSFTPDIASVIFDEAHLSSELFINRTYLGSTDDTGPKYLPPAEQRFSSIYDFNGAVSGTNSQTPSYSFNNTTVLSYGESHFTAETSVSNQGLRFDTAAASMDKGGLETTAGLFRSIGTQLITDRDMAGVSVATSSNTRLDARKIEGNDIILYLPHRSLVAIYREGRLYSSRAYDAGNQHIDTTELPQGAYVITLKIQDIDGTTREETRFFAKAPEIPPPGIPTYYAQAGVLRMPPTTDRAIPQLTSQPLVTVGTVRRISDNLGLESSLIGIDDRGLLESGLFLLEPGLQLRGTLLGSSRGDYGAQTSALYVMGKWNAAFDARRLWAAENRLITIDNAAMQPAVQSLSQATSSIGYAATPDLTLGLRATASAQYGSLSSQSYGPTVQWYLWREGESMLSLNADTGETNHRYTANAFLQFSMRLGKYGATGNTGFHHGDNDTGPSGAARLFHDDLTPEHELLLGAGFQKDPQTRSAEADADWKNTFGLAHGIVQESQTRTGSALTYGGNFSFTAAQWEDKLHVGGNQTDLSAVIVEAEGDTKIPMRVLVNGLERGLIAPGQRQAIYLAPFQIYNVRLVASQSALLDYDSGNRRVTLYPGNVVHLHWSVNNFYVVLARLTTPEGKPLPNATLQESTDPIATDSNGRLQAQMAHPKRLTFITESDEACETALPEVTPINGVLIYKKPLVCTPIGTTTKMAAR